MKPMITMGVGYVSHMQNVENVLIEDNWQKKLADLGWTFEIK